jgi:cell division septum initiation protein DivIVA
MSDRLDRIEALLEGHGMAMADIRARQEITQNQIDSLTALIADTRQAAFYLLETANNHENRLVKLETPKSDTPPN